MRSSLKYIALVIIALLLAAGATFYYVSIYFPGKEAQLTMTSIKNSKPAVDALYTGQYDIAETNLRALIEQAPTKSERARLQVLLMATLFDAGKDSANAEAASIAYNLVNDYSVPAWIRVTAYNTLARVVYAHINDVSFYKTYFNKPPFDVYLGTSGTNQARMWDAYFALFKASDEIYPTSMAEYSIAGYYFMLLVTNSPIQQTREEVAALMQKYVAEGDTRDDRVSQAPGVAISLYAPYTLILNQLIRAQATALSNKILKNHPAEESETAYIKVKTVAEYVQSTGVDMNNPKIQAVLFTWRFAYADFLMTIFGSDRADDIKTVLAPFGTLTSTSVINFLEKGGVGGIQNLPATNEIRIKALKLANVSPEFKAFLTRMGVKF
ncbi:hypothetical protein A2590_02350 [Candidatus Adlerbacteria bacterium RIFOXYD1_FULL_48_8]|nr:MAG: hypothetical protein A2590_02350 [Candidatus Adlerbacteria bacterium RIFOXYD1_FULL_48_8]